MKIKSKTGCMNNKGEKLWIRSRESDFMDKKKNQEQIIILFNG